VAAGADDSAVVVGSFEGAAVFGRGEANETTLTSAGLSDGFVARFAGRLINIHPSLLPAFPGLATHRQAIAAGVRVHGATVHFVSGEVDGGAIIAQAAVTVLPSDSEETLAARVLQREHQLLPRCTRWLAEGKVALREGRAETRDLPAEALALLG
jgi:phosphoribosylglycinamide formyltransferase-1